MDLEVPAPKFPEEIFSLEVWAMIFDRLKSPSDVENCYNTSKAWRELLKPKRPNFLMPQVFPLIYDYLVAEDKIQTAEEDEEEEELPYLDILKMRLVSRFWREAVDTYYQNHPSLSGTGFLENGSEEIGPRTLTRTPFRELLRHYKFGADRVTKLERFIGKNFAADSNPFLCRYVSYNDYLGNHDQPEPDELIRARARTLFRQLLSSFGSQISTCVLSFQSETGRAELYKLVRCCLVLMPNLKSLKISVSDRYAKLKVDSLKTGLENLLHNQPLPNSEKLRDLMLWNVPFPLSVGILTRNPRLRMLSVKQPIPDYFSRVQKVQLGQLEKLILEVRKSDKIDWQPIQNLTWPVKVLMLRARREKLETLFQAVSAFAPTLEELNLTHDNSRDSQALQNLRLQLPNLKKLELRLLFPLNSIHFLEGCSSLQEMEVEVYRRIPGTQTPMDKKKDLLVYIAQLFTYRVYVHNSEVWNALPLLSQITIKPMCVKGFFPIGKKYGVVEEEMQHIIYQHREADCEIC